MAGDRKSTKFTGVRFREHMTRRHRGKPDHYFFMRIKVKGRLIEEGLGWASEGWTAQRASLERAKLKEAYRTGEGPVTLREKRELKAAKEQVEARDSMLFRELAGQWVEWSKANKKSWKHDERRLKLHVLPILGDLKLKEVKAGQVEQLKVIGQEKGQAPASINHNLQVVRAAFNYAIRLELFNGANPTKGVKFIKHDNKRTRFLSYEEAGQLLEELAKTSTNWRDIAQVATYTGLRFGEIAALTWNDVDLEHGVLNVRDAKSGEGRAAYLTDQLQELFERRKEKAKNGLVFPGRRGGIMPSVSRTFDRAVLELGWNDGITDKRQRVVFHSLRHTFGSWLAIQGTPLLTIKELMGHKTIEMTMRYAHLIPDQKIDAVRQMEARATAKVADLGEMRRAKNGG